MAGKSRIINGSGGRPLQMRKMRAGDIGPRTRKHFLEMLAGTCNVSWSARAAGRTVNSFYQLRMRDERFREQWSEALEQGYARLEAMLIERATGLTEDVEIDGDVEVPEASTMNVQLAMDLLRQHRANGATQKKSGRPQGKATAEETDAYILKKLRLLNKRLRGND